MCKSPNEAFGSWNNFTCRHHINLTQFVSLVSPLRRKNELSSIHQPIPGGLERSCPFSGVQAQHCQEQNHRKLAEHWDSTHIFTPLLCPPKAETPKEQLYESTRASIWGPSSGDEGVLWLLLCSWINVLSFPPGRTDGREP